MTPKEIEYRTRAGRKSLHGTPKGAALLKAADLTAKKQTFPAWLRKEVAPPAKR